MLVAAKQVSIEMAPPQRVHRWASPHWKGCLAVSALGAIGAGVVFLGAHTALIDDSYITLDYARTFAEHGQWGLQPGHQANTATSPLNVMALAGLIALTGRPVLSAGILLMISLAATGAALAMICARLGRGSWLAAMAVSLLVVNPLLVSTIGLETYLGIALIAALGAAVVYRRPALAGVASGLLVLTRADLVAFALAGLIALISLTPARSRARGAALVIGLASVVTLPWFVVSWWWLGSAIPDTFLFKISETWGGNSFGVGLWHYGLAFPAAIALAVLPAGVGVCAGVRTLALRCLAGARRDGNADALTLCWSLGAVVHLGVFLLLRPPPYHWYYGPAIAALTMVGVFGMATSPRPLPRRSLLGRSAARVGPIAGAVLIVGGALFLASQPWKIMPISSNWASSSEYAALAARIPSGATVQSFGEVGTVAFFADATVVDRFSDRAQVVELLREKRATAGPLARILIDINYYRLKADPPIHAAYRFAFAKDPSGVAVTSSWRPYGGQMVVQLIPRQP